MKTAYELAMERLSKSSPSKKLTAGQKRDIAELESRCKSKTAEKELALGDQIAAAEAEGDFTKMEELKQQLVNERKKLQQELEEKKEKIRSGG